MSGLHLPPEQTCDLADSWGGVRLEQALIRMVDVPSGWGLQRPFPGVLALVPHWSRFVSVVVRGRQPLCFLSLEDRRF